MGYRRTLEFLLYDWLKTEALSERPRFKEHSRETFSALFDSCARIAKEKYAPFNRLLDTQEPRFDGERVVLPQAAHDGYQAYVETGLLAASQDAALGGMQLPYVIESAANSFLSMASISMSTPLLTVGNANAILAHGLTAQKEVFAVNQLSGRWSGTMCLSETQAGSSLSDIVTRAELEKADDALGPRYRLFGNKMWISAGDHELTENIVHLVLAKIPGPDGKLIAGTRGISLFIVPKKLVDSNGLLTGERNDVAVAGLNHKLGWRGTVNTLLNFGEGKYLVEGKPGAVGYLVGAPGEGLKAMFHMMNEARIGIGLAATSLGFAGYEASLEYAKQRTQGRPIVGTGKDATAPQVRLIEHADVKRMLLKQKAYCEGALALQLFCASLVDAQRSAPDAQKAEAALVLEVLMPIAKSWPSENCLEANSLAIQILGGYGYTRDFPVEQYWREQRLNMIHEGTHGIQALDLLGRKVTMQDGKGLAALGARIVSTAKRASAVPALETYSQQLRAAVELVNRTTQSAWSSRNPQEALANAVPYMQAFGHVVIAWMWLEVRLAAESGGKRDEHTEGIAAATSYFFRYELPHIEAWLKVVGDRDMTCAAIDEASF
jgi:alkylation response protein AidB-like acyl-CoA dehydrogenase